MAYQYDKASIKARLVNGLSAKASWAKILDYSTNMRMVDAITEIIEDLASYDEYLVRENNFELAQNTSSLMTKAKFLNYDAHRKVASTGNLRVSYSPTFNGSFTDNIIIPKYTTFSSEGLFFVCTERRTLLRYENYVDVPIAQGIYRSQTFTAVGESYESFKVNNDSIASDHYEVWVNNEQYTEVNRIIESDSNAKTFEIRDQLSFEGIQIFFGNDIFGRKLNSGDSVVFKYVETIGQQGNIGSTGIITTVTDTIYDINGDSQKCYCSNYEVIDGGQNVESSDSIRANAPKIFQSGERAITANDYEALLDLHPYIQHSNVWGAYEYNIDNNNSPWDWIPIEENVLHVATITPAGLNLSNTQKLEITQYLLDYKPPTDIVQFEDADIILLAFHVDAKLVNETYNLDEEKVNISNAIAEEYAYDQLGFNNNIYSTEFTRLINDIDSIAYHVSYISMYQEDLSFNISFIMETTLKILDIEPETVKVYIKDNTQETPEYILAAVDNGSNGFTAQPTYTVDVGSSIDYTDGSVSLQMTGLSEAYDDYDLRIEWETSKANMILDSRDQIFVLGEYTDITTSYLGD